ncbi:MAG: thioredoxin family protein [Nitrospirae bacterium]|nr:thioredoxin family protein [Nitrospirota bacterium]
MDISIGKQIVKFEMDNCGPCKAIKPLWNKIKEENPNVQFQEIHVEEDNDLAEKYAIIAVPTFMALSEGNEIERIVGLTNKNGLQNLINLLV